MTNLLMNRTRSRILNFLSKTGPSTSVQISVGIGLSPSAVRRHLATLIAGGFVAARPTVYAQHATVSYYTNAALIKQQCSNAHKYFGVPESD